MHVSTVAFPPLYVCMDVCVCVRARMYITSQHAAVVAPLR